MLLVDVAGEVEKVLTDSGYDVSCASFGKIFETKRENRYYPIDNSYIFPVDTIDFDVVVLDLGSVAVEALDQNLSSIGKGVGTFWTSAEFGRIDFRALRMDVFSSNFNRMLSHGAVFIVFASNRQEVKYVWGELTGRYEVYESKIYKNDNYSFLSVCEDVSVIDRSGREMSRCSNSRFDEVIDKYVLEGSVYKCIFEPHLRYSAQSWLDLVKNKYGETVSGVLAVDGVKSYVVFFPQVENKAPLVQELFQSVLPSISPEMFPDQGSFKWLENEIYELQPEKKIRHELEALASEYESRKSALEDVLRTEKENAKFIYDIVTETGDSLVKAVIHCFEVLGFKSIVDCDKSSDGQVALDEDLQIRDYSPLLLVEIKGLVGFPKDSEALQVLKYVPQKMKKYQRMDVKGLSIVNCQRFLPPLERGNPFRDVLITNAIHSGIGLMTTWDLHCLVRNYLKNNWKHDDIKGIFYQDGRVVPLPINYEFIGVVKHYYPGQAVVSIELNDKVLGIGDVISIESDIEFDEFLVESMEVSKEQVSVAVAGSLVGVKCALANGRSRIGCRVYKIKK